jgi:fused signal recognition particle receptor
MSRRMDKASLAFSQQVKDTVTLRRDLDDSFYDDLTEVLVSADTGVVLSEKLVAELRETVREQRVTSSEEALQMLKGGMLNHLEKLDRRMEMSNMPSVVMFVGVNGNGKTTTIGKLAWRLGEDTKTCIIAAADTYRAAAIDQMRIWGDRSGSYVVSHQAGSDPGAVVYDAISAAHARQANAVLIDTAGRLHTKHNLMAELVKIKSVCERVVAGAPHEILLVVEATTGMNALAQAKAFHETLGLTGIVLTKLDGTSRGGTLLGIEAELNVPVKMVGLGEDIDDLNEFDPKAYLDALFAGVFESVSP